MAVEIIHDSKREIAVLIDNTTDWAFGPVFQGPGCAEDAQDFLDWLKQNPGPNGDRFHFPGSDGTDAREYTQDGLERTYYRWREADEASGKRRGVEI